MGEDIKNQGGATTPANGAEKNFTQADVDRAVSQAIATYATNSEKKLREQIEQEFAAKNEMTAEEKVNKILADKQKEWDERDRQSNIRDAKIEMKNAGFSEEEINFHTSDLPIDQEKASAKVKQLCDFRKKNQEDLEKQFKDSIAGQMGNNMQSGNGGGNSLQDQYDKCKAQGDDRSIAEMSALLRQAESQNIKLN